LVMVKRGLKLIAPHSRGVLLWMVEAIATNGVEALAEG
jgi:hypothetical protein